MTDNRKLTARLMFRLLPIQILLMAIGAINGIVTSLFASNSVGAQAMTAVGLYNPISLFIGAMSTILVGGSMILCGRYMGKNLTEKVQSVFSLDVALTLLLSAALVAFHLAAALGAKNGFLTKDPEIWRSFRRYLLGMAIGVLPQILGNQLAAFLSLQNRTRRTTAASLVFIAVNVVLNYLFLIVLHMEAFGVALASSLGMWAFFLVEAGYFLSPSARLRLRLRGADWRESPEILRIGTPGAMGYVYQTVRGLIVNALVLTYVGGAGLSAFAASNALLGLFWAIPGGMAAVSRMIFSVSVGEEDRQTLTDAMRTAIFRFVPLMAAIALGIIALAVPFTRLYYRDAAEPVYGMTVWAFRILPVCMPLGVVCMQFTTYWQASGRMMPVHLLALLDGMVSVSAFTALLIPLLGMNSVYIANVLNGIVSILVILFVAWYVNKRFPRSVPEAMCIPAGFGAAEDERMDLSVKSVKEVVRVAEEVHAFCRDRGLDERTAHMSALCLEEMAGNVVEHGFTKDRKPHSVAIRVVHTKDHVILRLRDDCVPFDPAEREAMRDPEDPAKNVGIRMVYSIAEKIEYQNLLGLNVLTMRL